MHWAVTINVAAHLHIVAQVEERYTLVAIGFGWSLSGVEPLKLILGELLLKMD